MDRPAENSGIDRARLAALKQREDAAFAARTPGSRRLLERGRKSMPSGVPMSWMAGLSEHPRSMSRPATARISPTWTATATWT